MSDIIKHTTTTDLLANWEQKKELANVLLKSKFLPQALTTPEQVIAVMLKGQELGIPTMEALTSINVIQGKPTISPQLMLALARRTGELENFQIEKGPDSITVTVKRKGQSAVESVFGNREAVALGLAGKDNYKKQPHVMYQWRALAANLRLTFPDVIAGMYTPEEMGAVVTVGEGGTMEVAALPEIRANVDTRTGEIKEPVKDGVFNPATEPANSKKYPEMTWAQLPSDYLEWTLKNSKSNDSRKKATATLKWLKMQEQAAPAQENFVSETFPEDGAILFDELCSTLTEAAHTYDNAALVKWAADNELKIKKLKPQEKDLLRKSYKEAMKDAKKAEEVAA